MIYFCLNRLDSGKYKIAAENEFGSDSGFLHVTVIDRPDPPVGPVVYTNVDRETIKLEWKVPEDDGGSDIRYAFIDMLANCKALL